jgi:uncharacterized protein
MADVRHALTIAVLLLVACSHTQTQKPAEPEVVLLVAGQPLHVKVELCRTEAERNRGMMFRTSLESGRGMLFLFEQPSVLKFWMKNTLIPLDMIFMDEQKRVVFVEHNATPQTYDPRGPDTNSQFVLEVPGGWARSHGIEPGVTAHFVSVD